LTLKDSVTHALRLRHPDVADKRQFTELMGHIHAVADNEFVGAKKAAKIGGDIGGEMAGFLEQHGGQHTTGAAGGDEILSKGEGAAGFKDVVDQENVAPLHFRLDVAQNLDAAGRSRVAAIARKDHEVDFRRKTGAEHGPHQIGGENEASLEHRHDKQPMRPACRDILGERIDAPGNLVFGEQDRYRAAVDLECFHGLASEPISSIWAKRICTDWPPPAAKLSGVASASRRLKHR